MRLPFGLVTIAASLGAVTALIGFAYLSGAAPWGANIFRTPIPYVLFVICWFVVTPAYLALSPWFGLRLDRFVLGALGLSLLLTIYVGWQWGWDPAFLNASTLTWILGFPLVGALSYRFMLRLLAPELGAQSQRPR